MNQKYLVRIVSIAVVLFVSVACANHSTDSSSDRLTTKKAKKLPVSKVSQSLNVAYQNLFPLLVQNMKGRGIPIAKVDSSTGAIESEPLQMEEVLCGSHGADRAPLDCITLYKYKVKPVSEIASSFTLEYEQTCDAYGLGQLSCPGSNAERLLFELVDEVKLKAGVVDEDKN